MQNKKQKRKIVPSLKCVACDEDLPEYNFEEEYCSDCLRRIRKTLDEEIQELLKNISEEYIEG